MIDSTTEHLLSLAQAAEQLPRRRRGKKTNVATVYRWSKWGCRGVFLETIQVGATRCTSTEALQRFFEALTVSSGEVARIIPNSRSIASRTRQSEVAGRKLEERGA